MKKSLILTLPILFTLSIFGCTTEKPKPESRWDVKVSTQSGERKIWVWKSDGSKQCGGPAKITPDSAAREAKAGGLMVYQFRKDSDGQMYPSVCGAGTGSTVELEIPMKELNKAIAMGYKAKTSN